MGSPVIGLVLRAARVHSYMAGSGTALSFFARPGHNCQQTEMGGRLTSSLESHLIGPTAPCYYRSSVLVSSVITIEPDDEVLPTTRRLLRRQTENAAASRHPAHG